MSETPILDLERDPPKSRRSWIRILCGVLIGVTIAKWATIDGLWWFPMLYASIAFHEMGHLAAAKLMGMEAGGIVVGGLMILKSGDRWLCRFEFRRILSGGLAKPLPKKGDFDCRRYAWMVAGGPFATLLLVAVCAIGGWFGTLFWINLALFLSTFLPSSGVNKSDIPRLWLLLRKPDQAKSWIALLQVMAEETNGVRPRDWDPDMVEQMLRPDPKTGDNAFRQMLAFYRRVDQGDEAATLPHLEAALAASGTCGRLVRHWCFLEASCSSAMLRGNPAAARTWIERATRLRKPLSRLSIDAAIAQSEHRYADALRLWDESLAFIAKQRFDSGLTRYAKAKIAEYQQQCREALKSPGRTELAASSPLPEA